jgi:hypothetical protein
MGETEQERRQRQDELDRGARERRESQPSGGGCMEGFLLLWIGPALIIHWLNFALPFWMRCIIAVAAGAITANYAGRKWGIAPTAKFITFAIVTVLLFAFFRDENGIGLTAFKIYSYLLGLAGWVLGAVVVFGLIGGWFKGYFAAFRANPPAVGCITLVVGWLFWLLFIHGPDHPQAPAGAPATPPGAAAPHGVAHASH